MGNRKRKMNDNNNVQKQEAVVIRRRQKQRQQGKQERQGETEQWHPMWDLELVLLLLLQLPSPCLSSSPPTTTLPSSSYFLPFLSLNLHYLLNNNIMHCLGDDLNTLFGYTPHYIVVKLTGSVQWLPHLPVRCPTLSSHSFYLLPSFPL